MMPLLNSPYDKCVREFLNFLDHDLVSNIARVATNSRILPTTTEEAVDIILLHTCDVARFFSYRSIKSQILFTYLHHHGVSCDGQVSKTQLISAVNQLWVQRIQSKSVPSEPHRTVIKRRASDPLCNDTSKEEKVSKLILRKKGPSSLSVSESSSPADFSLLNQEEKIADVCNPSVSPSPNRNVVKSDLFSRDFCDWYYTMLNRLQPECAHQAGDTFRENIFFNNSSVDVFLVGEKFEEKHSQGPSGNFTLLTDVCKALRLLFSPNVDSGIQAYKSTHGMVRVMCCGTLFQGSTFIGIFEQEFGLMFCPIDRVWKIMYSKVNLKQTAPQEMPRLPPCQVFEIEN